MSCGSWPILIGYVGILVAITLSTGTLVETLASTLAPNTTMPLNCLNTPRWSERTTPSVE